MPFDAIVASALAKQFTEELVNTRVTKVYQPDSTTFTFLCRRPGKNETLTVRVDPANAGLYLSSTDYVNPEVPPAFCMLLRKHLENGRIVEVKQPGFERILIVVVENLDDRGDLVVRMLVAEIMGRYSNLVLLDENQVIIDAARRVSHEVNRVREILPGARYIPPPPQEKANPLSVAREQFYNLLYPAPGNAKLTNLLVNHLAGIGPLSAREIVCRAGFGVDVVRGDLDDEGFARLWQYSRSVFDQVKQGLFCPYVVLDSTGIPSDYAALEITHLGEKGRREATISRALEAVIERKARQAAVQRWRSELSRVVDTHLGRVQRKIAEQRATLDEARDAEEFRVKGELLTAGMHLVKPGDREVKVPNYYSEDQEPMAIPLDPSKSAAANAQAYFRKYAKLKKSVTVTKEQLAKALAEKSYLNQVATFLEIAETVPELEEIRQELAEGGYIRFGRKSRRLPPASQPERFISSDGYEILVGRNNQQNEKLTLHTARPADLWLHVKDIPGAHVIVRAENETVPPRSLEEAAVLAAYYSKARESSKVAVDYTLRKYVRKPKGSRPGMVIYDHQQTILVTPDETRVKAIKKA